MTTDRSCGPLKGAVLVLCLLAACSGDSDPTGAAPPQGDPPQITTQPRDTTVNAGSAASFSVDVTGTAPMSYQWKRDGAVIPGATGASYLLPSVAALDSAARFTVVVSNQAGSVESRQARIQVRVGPSITAQPQDQTVDEGGAVTFSVSATGTGPLSYQWERDGTPIAGATAAAYVLSPVAATDSTALFTVAVSNQVGTVVSRQARIAVRTAPAIVAQPTAQSVLSGVPARFVVEAAGPDLGYQWRRDGVDIAGATGSEYFVGVPLAGDDGAEFSVVVTNDLGSVTSQAATLQVRLDREIRPTSYANAKALNVAPADLPPGTEVWTAQAFADFFGAGNRDLFVANSLYDMNAPLSQAIPGEFQFWRWTPSGYVRDTSLRADETGCIHPRTAAVADFNADARPDVFVACHGYDRDPFPGEPSYLVLSQPGGSYSVQAVGDAGFYHGAAAADLDADGDIDVVATDNFSQQAVFAFVNDGAGGLTERTDFFSVGWGSYFIVEAADVNGDGLVDVMVGGHEWEGAATMVLLNDGSGSFAGVAPVLLPAVASEGVILDFTVLDADQDGVSEIYVARTSGGDGTFYQSRTVQRVQWPDLASDVLLSVRPAAPAYYLIPLYDGSAYSLALVTPDDPGATHRLLLP